VWKIEVAVGILCEEDALITLESMKMEIPSWRRGRDGNVILVQEGEAVAEGDIAVILG